eukprot:CAMPEP_0169429410 /NCGR_PEP_ID=MMETSP1042-20121227/1851_1 /TAXON_ID=464988 /ORGANISM="Hemiselmis andersenii, Strain CCMP1180" /LENGTH=51 /DNA_ID=CAMNT_0009539657 /DNA_START=186 /DNA_END=341 /DNA_ORIENTATION=+
MIKGDAADALLSAAPDELAVGPNGSPEIILMLHSSEHAHPSALPGVRILLQ